MIKCTIFYATIGMLLLLAACNSQDRRDEEAPPSTRTVNPVTVPTGQHPSEMYLDGDLIFSLPEGWVVDESMASSRLIAFFNSQEAMDAVGGINAAISSVFSNIQQSLEGTPTSPQPIAEFPDGAAMGIVMLIPRDVSWAAMTPQDILTDLFSEPDFTFSASDIIPITVAEQPGAQAILNAPPSGGQPVTGLVGLVEYGDVYALSMMFAYQADFDSYRPTFEAIMQSVEVSE